MPANPFEPPLEHGPEEQDAEGWRISHQQMVLEDHWAIMVELAAQHDEVFAGHWWDNTTDPVTIVLALTDVNAPVADQIRQAVPYPEQLRIVSAQRTVADLERLADRIRPDLPQGVGMWIDTVNNAVVVSQNHADAAIDTALAGAWGEAVIFEPSTFRYALRNLERPQP